MNQKPIDKIFDAYKGELGKEFSEKTRNRVNWIVNQVKGENILDIGCSQGIVPIILGREGKSVDAIDIAEESIQYAKKELDLEHSSVKELVQFRVTNFMTEFDFKESYDTVLLTEVLEHISDTKNFLNKIHSLLEENGDFIVTVPFGINDYFDHKRTYYFLELFDQINELFDITKIEYLGKWVGYICKKGNLKEKNNSFERYYIKQLEEAFYMIERDYVTTISNYQQQVAVKNKQINNEKKSVQDEIMKMQQELADKNKQLQQLTTKQKEQEKKLEIMAKDGKVIDELKKQLAISLDSEKNVLEKLLKSKNDYDILLNENKKITHKYQSLKNSKLGKLTLKYWALRNKRRS